MMTQEVPTRFWNSGYCLMCLLHFLMASSLFLQFPLFHVWANANGFDYEGTSLCAALFGIGMFLPGPFNSFMVDAYKRKIIFVRSILGLIALSVALYYVHSLLIIAFIRLLQGACYGIFQMTLGSTLINDLSISSHRTQTDYYYLWFGRFGMPAGLVAASYVNQYFSFDYAVYLSVALMVVSFLLSGLLHVSFRAPIKVPVISLDRFWQPQAKLLVLNLLPVAIIPGLFMSGFLPLRFILLIAAGLLIAFITHRTIFEEADPRADAVAGLLMILSAMIMLLVPSAAKAYNIAYVLLGVGYGWFQSRLLLYFLKMSSHCQRGTLQNTYILVCYLGICIGYYVSSLAVNIYIIGVVLSVVSMLLYLLVTHRWFVKNKSRNFKFREI